jgi:FkbM family methyltransferase
MGYSVGTFFDVGAHTGETSSAALANFPEAEVFAFEPPPPTFSVLQEKSRPAVRGSGHFNSR